MRNLSIHIIVGYKDIPDYPIGGVEKDAVAIVCTGKEYLPWYSSKGTCVMVKVLYSAGCDGTLVSPTNMVSSSSDKFQGFTIEENCNSGTGQLKLLHRDGVSHSTYPLIHQNGLRFHSYDPAPQPSPTVNQLNEPCLSAVWHGRLGCAGNNVMDNVHKHVVGIDKPLRINPF